MSMQHFSPSPSPPLYQMRLHVFATPVKVVVCIPVGTRAEEDKLAGDTQGGNAVGGMVVEGMAVGDIQLETDRDSLAGLDLGEDNSPKDSLAVLE